MNEPNTAQPASWDTDKQFTEVRIEKVTPMLGNWVVTGAGLHTFLGQTPKAVVVLPNTRCTEEPKVGELARLYGASAEHVRGMVVEGRVYHYLSPAEEQEALDRRERRREQRRQEVLDRDREHRDARRAMLPESLRARVEAFIARGGEAWRRDVEAFELDVLDVTARVMRLCGNDVGRFYDFDALDTESQRKRLFGTDRCPVPDKSWEVAIALAGFAMVGGGELLPFMHATSCYEGLGCHRGACASVSPELFEGSVYKEALEGFRAGLADRMAQGDERTRGPEEASGEIDTQSRGVVEAKSDTARGMNPPRTVIGTTVIGGDQAVLVTPGDW